MAMKSIFELVAKIKAMNKKEQSPVLSDLAEKLTDIHDAISINDSDFFKPKEVAL